MTRSTSTPRLLPPTGADLRFDLVAKCQWKVRDARRSRDDTQAILGAVSAVAGLYEVVRVGHPTDIAYCLDLDAARAHFTTRSTANNAHLKHGQRTRG